MDALLLHVERAAVLELLLGQRAWTEARAVSSPVAVNVAARHDRLDLAIRAPHATAGGHGLKSECALAAPLGAGVE
jgi:hypothetical protein